MAPCCWTSLKFSIRGPLVATNFQSFSSKSNKNQDIFLKFSAFVHHIANMTKKFCPFFKWPAHHGPFQPKLWTPLATVFVEIFQREKIWWGSRPIWVTSWKEFPISLKKWHFGFFRTSKASTLMMSTAERTIEQFGNTFHCELCRVKKNGSGILNVSWIFWLIATEFTK